MGGRPRKSWDAIDVPLEGRTVPPAARLRPGHPTDGLNWVPSALRVTLFIASPRGLTHLHTFCLATQYLFQGKGRKYYFSKRKKKSQDLRSGSPHRARWCPVTHHPPPFFFKDKAAGPASEATVSDPRAGGGAGLKVSCGDPSPWRMGPPTHHPPLLSLLWSPPPLTTQGLGLKGRPRNSSNNTCLQDKVLSFNNPISFYLLSSNILFVICHLAILSPPSPHRRAAPSIRTVYLSHLMPPDSCSGGRAGPSLALSLSETPSTHQIESLWVLICQMRGGVTLQSCYKVYYITGKMPAQVVFLKMPTDPCLRNIHTFGWNADPTTES